MRAIGTTKDEVSMTELAGGELCLPQRPHNQVGAARRRRRILPSLEDTRQQISWVEHILKPIQKCLLRKHIYSGTPLLRSHTGMGKRDLNGEVSSLSVGRSGLTSYSTLHWEIV